MGTLIRTLARGLRPGLLALLLPTAPGVQAEVPGRAVADGVHCDGGDLSRGALIAFAGWRVPAELAWGWMQALAPHAGREATALRCAVRGPQDASYRREDLDTAAFARHLVAHAAAGAPGLPVVVVAHSSGSYVAQRWLRQLREQGDAGRALLARIEYHNLDGDIGSGERELDRGLIGELASVQAVLAVDGAGGESANAPAMRALAATAPQRVRLRVLEATAGVCAPASERGARWCLHQTLITPRPARRDGFDVSADYAAAARGAVQPASLLP
jgi:hypothetical protein